MNHSIFIIFPICTSASLKYVLRNDSHNGDKNAACMYNSALVTDSIPQEDIINSSSSAVCIHITGTSRPTTRKREMLRLCAAERIHDSMFKQPEA